tara:strand:+ start:761 stop:1120 length:360 start_codon:yes stop_codon:yes gene_type:complete
MPAPYPSTPIPPKKPELNGGLYTGEPFRGAWGNVPVIPDVVPMTKKTLTMQTHPYTPGSTEQFDPTMIRPGNNMPFVIKDPPGRKFSETHTFHCTSFDGASDSTIRSFDPVEQVGSSWN